MISWLNFSSPIILAITLFMGFVYNATVAAQLAPHRAIYSVSLSPDSQNSLVTAVDGIMSMSVELTCDGWIFSQDMKTSITTDIGGILNQSALFTSWESLDGFEYRFASRVKTGDGQDILRGSAVIALDGSGMAVYRDPEVVKIALPKGTMFPVSHTIWLIESAKTGVRIAPRIVFSGSEGLDAELVNAFIGDPISPEAHNAGQMGPLVRETGWPLSMAFYPISSETGVPTFEIRVLQLENGVSPEIYMNFGEFTARLLIQSLETIDHPQCF